MKVEKYCARCLETKPVCKFVKNTARHDGLNVYCRLCQNEYGKELYHRNFERIKEAKRASTRKSYRRHRRERIEYSRKWRVDNPDRVKEQFSNWYNKNKEYNRIRVNVWYNKHNHLARAKNVRREMKYKALVATLTGKEWMITLSLFDNACAYCGSKDRITKDHLVPLSAGGAYELGNIVPACKSCNCSKQDKVLGAWLKDKTKLYGILKKVKLLRSMK